MLLRYAEKTELQNVMQGSYKFQFRSPAGSHLSKLVATPEMSTETQLIQIIHDISKSPDNKKTVQTWIQLLAKGENN